MNADSKSSLTHVEEIFREAFSNVAASLTSLLGLSIEISLLALNIVPPTDCVTALHTKNYTDVVATAYSQFKGDWNGLMLFMLPVHDASETISYLIGSLLGETEISEEMAEETFKEIANIAFGSLTSVLFNKYGIRLEYSPPSVVVDALLAILDNIATSYSFLLDKLLMIEMQLTAKCIQRAYMIVIPTGKFMELIENSR